ncbi:hypothetical protein BN2497_4693 [Janthinobacterium sp. CG23_2]|nr:hypothetical protein BN2497_4693 [Janthinobacterium sp. CG23_2]CUU28744.1 hypothetical protein BN3177_4693 [Janthinobacterium sp. CG23_2]
MKIVDGSIAAGMLACAPAHEISCKHGAPALLRPPAANRLI